MGHDTCTLCYARNVGKRQTMLARFAASLIVAAWLGSCAIASQTPLDGGGDASTIADASASTDAVTPMDVSLPAPRCVTDTRSLAVGYGTACRVDSSGQLWCWGRNDWGQVRPGGGTWAEPVPVPYAGMTDVRSIALAFGHACAVHQSGAVSCWGANEVGQLGDGTMVAHHAPAPVLGVTDADAIVLGNTSACARERDGRWRCWGSDWALVELTASSGPLLLPREAPALAGARSVWLESLAIARADGTVLAHQVLGDHWGVAYVPGLDGVVEVAGGDSYAEHTHALRNDGSVWSFGDGPAARVAGIDDVRSLLAYDSAAEGICAVRGDGSLWCWTRDAYDHDSAPTPLAGGVDVERAAVGSFVCVSTCSGAIFCNGDEGRGENGDGTEEITPHEVGGVDSAVSVDDDCVLLADGTVTCWDPGYPDASGGDPRVITPRVVSGVAHAIATADRCAILEGGTFACWPEPSWPAASGYVASVAPPLPAPVAELRTIDVCVFARTTDQRLFYGSRWSAAGWVELPAPAPAAELSADGAVRLTDGRVFDIFCISAADLVATCSLSAAWPGITDATRIWTGPGADCAERASGGVWCRLTDPLPASVHPLALALGADPSRRDFQHVPVLDGAVQIVPDGTTLCARSASGAVDCWGDPSEGRLGANDLRTHTQPVADGAVSIGVGEAVCAVRAGRLICWGRRDVAYGYASGAPYVAGSGASWPAPLDRRVLTP